ncbi:MAG: Eco57I restriction-modification methylase domain-containing protein [Bacteroidetes bacterium]|nr:Eco57I restriction-modification methylase domain-containing protein [Bacteroidota bacterium]
MKIDFKKLDANSITNSDSKTTFGEVFTPNELITEMLDKLPKDIWKKEKNKWLDPAAGVGNFHAAVYSRLMIGLKTIIKDENERKKHILENMLFFVELQEKSSQIINEIFNPENNYKLNLLNNDFCGLNIFDFNVMNFDVILGNPPYQDMYTDVQRKAKNHNLWSTFLEKGFDMLNSGGYLLFVTPPAWMSPSSKLLSNIFLKYQLHYVNIGECSRHFKGVGSQFSYYLIEKSKRYKSTTFQYSFKGGSFIKNSGGISEYYLNNSIKFIPQIPTKEAFQILEKTVFANNLKYQIQYDSDLHKFTKKDLLSVKKDRIYKYKVLHTPTQTVWSSRAHKNHNKIKLFIPLTTYYESLIIDTCGNTQGFGYIIFEDIITATRTKLVLASKLFRFIANITRWSNFNVPMVMKNLPYLPDNIEPTNENIYSYFKLSTEEIELIECAIKPHKNKLVQLC